MIYKYFNIAIMKVLGDSMFLVVKAFEPFYIIFAIYLCEGVDAGK